MVAAEMLRQLKDRANKLDSSAYRNVSIPQWDARLNEAQDIYIRNILAPRTANEVKQLIGKVDLESIRTIVQTSEKLEVSEFDDNSVVADLPENYRYFIKGYVNSSRRNCTLNIRVYPQKHDEEFEESPNSRSSFVFERCNSTLIGNDRIRLYHGGDFEINYLLLDYVRQPKYIHNADKWKGGKYNLLDGTTLEGSQDCELPERAHSEIIDIAVLILRGDLNTPEYQAAAQKLNLLN